MDLMSLRFDVRCRNDAIDFSAKRAPDGYGRVETAPYPFFPTDMQSLLLTLAACSCGKTVIVENLFENRLAHNAAELNKMGADISVENNVATVYGGKLHGANVSASDLRGGAGLVIAALAAEGQSAVSEIRHVGRGYVDLAGNLNKLGAEISVRD